MRVVRGCMGGSFPKRGKVCALPRCRACIPALNQRQVLKSSNLFGVAEVLLALVPALGADPDAELLSAFINKDRHEGSELRPVQAQECEPVLRLFACQDFGHTIGVL